MIKAAVIGGTECINDKLSLASSTEDYDILIVNYMSSDLLAKTALGLETEIIKALKNSKEVYVTRKALHGIDKLPKPLILLYNPHISTLKSIGVKLINYTDDIFVDKKCKKLLTVADFEGFSGTAFKTDAKTLITPLALDYARENNITITRDDTI